jgi:hypothetical protein
MSSGEMTSETPVEMLKRVDLAPGSAPPENQTIAMFERLMTAFVETRAPDVIDRLNRVAAQSAEVNRYIDTGDKRLREMKLKVESFYDSIGDPHIALAGFKASITEELKLQQARKLWTDAARSAGRAYRNSWFALVILLIGVPSLAIWQSHEIFAFFRVVGDAVLVDLPENASETAILIAAVSRLVLVTMPIVLFVWLIKLVVRFNARSLLLMDDARQRNTMLETYLHLVEQDKDVKADRPLILEALFRRTPGHGPETIEPPTLAELIRMGQPGVKP